MRAIFTPVALLFILYIIITNFDEISRVYQRPSLTHLTTSISLLIIANFIAPLLSIVILSYLNKTITYKQSLLIHLSRLPARYLPGGIWQTVAKLKDFNDRGIPVNLLKKVALYEILFSFSSAVLLALVLRSTSNIIMLFLAVLALGFTYTAKSAVKGYRQTNYHYWVTCILIYTPVWLGYSISFAFFFSSFNIAEETPLTSLASSYLIAWATGFLAIFAPQGVGVTEYAFCHVQKLPPANITVAFSLIFSFRFIIMAADLICWVASFLFKKLNRDRINLD